VRIASIGLDSPLMKLGLQSDGTMQVPPSGFPAGWYTGAPTPGEVGPAIIAAHIDWNGPAVSYDLHRLKPGDQIVVTPRTAARRSSASPGLRSSEESVPNQPGLRQHRPSRTAVDHLRRHIQPPVRPLRRQHRGLRRSGHALGLGKAARQCGNPGHQRGSECRGVAGMQLR
jgi:Sortase domain